MTGQQSAVKMPLFVRVGFALSVCSMAADALVPASVVVAPHIVLKVDAALKGQKRRKHRKPQQQQLKQQHQALRQQVKKSPSLNVQ